MDAETLAELLHEQAERDPELFGRLQLRATASGNELSESSGEAAKIGAVLDTVARLLDSGTQADVAPLARRTVDRIAEALRHGDDSSGAAGAELRRAIKLYARACAGHPPQPEQLADWIVGVVFGGAEIELADFVKALGDNGLRRIKSTVDEVLAEPGTEARRRAAERLDEQVAEITGDVDALLAILSRQPPRLDVSLKIVRVLRAAGRTTEAVAHAARALSQEKSQPPDDGTTEDGATEGEATADEVIRALIAEDRPEEAWEAARRLGTDPTEILVVYKAYIEDLIGLKDAVHYEQAAKALRKLRTLHRRAGLAAEFAPYLAELVRTHRRKTRLLTEISAARIALPKV
ncbi:hypothetical protein FPZ12_001110 [Amycolatopsis acidicola]|uniref:Uncharacterized protein n=1 Tax=Amycolatopsis acidicola TaxID=2596893 RepID=A0A5N0VMD4_9PSEU|nr:hypothetical protein FPZ12_001110 [Amycolatopsis acidicola]